MNLINYIQSSFLNVSMSNFIIFYAPHCSPLDVQIALYAQGLKHHTSKTRKTGLPSLSDSHNVLKELAKEERMRIWNSRVGELLAAARLQNAKEKMHIARLILEKKIKEFLEIHEGKKINNSRKNKIL